MFRWTQFSLMSAFFGKKNAKLDKEIQKFTIPSPKVTSQQVIILVKIFRINFFLKNDS